MTTIKTIQGDNTLEFYWGELQKLWVDFDARKPCPYTCCEKGTNIYRKETEVKRLHQFLGGLNDRYDSLRREILMLGDDTTTDKAFGIVKQEEGRTAVWNSSAKPSPKSGEAGIGAGFGARIRQPPPSTLNRPPAHNQQPPQPHSYPQIVHKKSTNQSFTAHTVVCTNTQWRHASSGSGIQSGGRMATN